MTTDISVIQEKHQTKLFTKYSAFFAYSNKQFNDSVNKNFGRIASLGSGLYCPSIFADKVISKLEQINKDAIAKLTLENSKKDIIWYAFANYETQITGDCTDAIDALVDYPGISKQDILNEYRDYYNHCVKNDFF